MSSKVTMNRRRFMQAASGLAAGAVVAPTAGCGGFGVSDGEEEPEEVGTTSFTAAVKPETTNKAQVAEFDALVELFRQEYPNYDLQPTANPGTVEQVRTLPAKLAAGELETTFRIPVASAHAPIANEQCADITELVQEWEHYDALVPAGIESASLDDRQYGLVGKASYFGLIYSRKMFAAAGLDPDQPPTTWDEFRDAAATLADPDNDVFGFAALRGIGGSWHFSGLAYSAGARIQTQNADGSWETDLDGPDAVRALQLLRDMRWEDRSLSNELFEGGPDVFPLMAEGRIGMYIGTPARVAAVINAGASFGLTAEDVGIGPLPQGGGDATLFQGQAYLFNPTHTEDQIKAALDFAIFQWLTPKSLDAQWAARTEAGETVPAMSSNEIALKPDSQLRAEIAELSEKYSDLPAEFMAPYIEIGGQQEHVGEPPVESQKVYSLLAPILEAVLTDESADPAEQLSTAAEQVRSQVLANA